MPSTNPSSSNDPPVYNSTAIKQAFRRACTILSRLWPRSEPDHSLVLLPNPRTLRSITIISCNLAPHWRRSQPPHILPYHRNDFDSEMQSYYQPKNSINLGKTTLGLSFQAIVALALSFDQSSSSLVQTHHDKHHLQLFQVAMVISFAASFIGIFLRNTYPRISTNIEKIGSLTAATGIFIITIVFFPRKFA